MPKLTANAKIFRDWEALLGACDKSTDVLGVVEPLRTELETLLTKGRESKLHQENLDGSKKAITQELRQIEAQGGETARKLRALVVSRIGTKTELGKMFGLVPTGRKPRKAKTPVAVKPPVPPASHASTAAEKAEPASTPVQPQGGDRG
jgi:hypothetical protein